MEELPEIVEPTICSGPVPPFTAIAPALPTVVFPLTSESSIRVVWLDALTLIAPPRAAALLALLVLTSLLVIVRPAALV